MMALAEMRTWSARSRRTFVALALALLAGCATVSNGDARDPFESFNRSMYGFNDGFDRAVTKPIASAYKEVVPDPIRNWVRNFFSNVSDIFIGLNNLLQGKPMDAVTDFARFGFNSTFGLFGLHDIASDIGLEKHNEDFGQTFGRWGAGSGPYIVWPFIGSSDVRDTIGSIFDIGLDPVRRHKPITPRNFMIALRATGQRADLLSASRILEEAALDKYVFSRDAYLQRRRNLIYDGSPPRESSSQLRRDDGGERSMGDVRVNPDPPKGVSSVDVERPKSAAYFQYEPSVPANYESVIAVLGKPGNDEDNR